MHAGLVYESVLESNWLVIDPEKNNSIGLVRLYIDTFVMFIMFFISGYFIPNSIKNKSSWNFIKSKIKRIFIPWVLAVIFLIPAYKAIFLFSRGLAQEEWFSYFHIFTREGSNLYLFSNNPSQSWLWFLPVLFFFQLIYLALSKTKLLSLKISLKTAVITTFIIGVAYGVILSTFDLMGWTHSHLIDFQNERLLPYFLLFLLGSLCNKLEVFNSTKKNTKIYIISNVVLAVSITVYTTVALNLFFNLLTPNRNYFFVSEFVDRLVYYITFFTTVLSFLHILIHSFRFKLNYTNKILTHLSAGSYSVYIIHMIVVGVIGLAIINISIPAFFKFIILSISTFIVSHMIVYSYRKTKQKKVTMKTILTAIIMVSLATTAYLQNPANESQSSTKEPSMGIHEAALQGNLKAIQQHIKAGSDLNLIDPMGGSTALVVAATFGKTEVAEALIEAGADLNLKNRDGSTALHSSTFFCHTDIVKALLAKGADKTLLNNSGSTALQGVEAPFELVKGIYDYFGSAFGPLGLKLDYEHLKTTRPKIAEMLKVE